MGAKSNNDVVWLVTEDAFQQLDRPRSIKTSLNGVLTSAALCELDVCAEPLSYRHIGTVGPRMVSEAIRSLK